MAFIKEMKVRKVPKNVVMKIDVKLTKEFWFRLWLATKSLQLAAWILGCGFEFNFTDDGGGEDAISPIKEGHIKKGGVNTMPKVPKPDIKPPSQRRPA